MRDSDNRIKIIAVKREISCLAAFSVALQREVHIDTPRCVSSTIILFTLGFSRDVQARFHDRSALDDGGTDRRARLSDYLTTPRRTVPETHGGEWENKNSCQN